MGTAFFTPPRSSGWTRSWPRRRWGFRRAAARRRRHVANERPAVGGRGRRLGRRFVGCVSSAERVVLRVTATQVALLSKAGGIPGAGSYLQTLSWSASKSTPTSSGPGTWSSVLLEVGLVLVFAVGTSSRDVLHGGYLVLALSFLRLRDAIMTPRFDTSGTITWRPWVSRCSIRRPWTSLASSTTQTRTPSAHARPVQGGLRVGVGRGQLGPDLAIFVIGYGVRSIQSRAYAAVVNMERGESVGARGVETSPVVTGRSPRVPRRHATREERRVRATLIRAEVAALSREVLELESGRDAQQTTDDRTSDDRTFDDRTSDNPIVDRDTRTTR